MLSRLTKWVVPAICGAFMLAVPAQAVPIVPSGTDVLVPTTQYTYSTLLTGGQVIGTPHPWAPIPSGDVFEFFVGPAKLGTVTTAISLNADPTAPGQAGFGVSDLVLTWYDSTKSFVTSLAITDVSGTVIDITAALSLTVFAPGPYYLAVTGTGLSLGGFYNIFVNTGPAGGSGVPLPPAVVLFGSALVGLALLKRRRSKRATEFTAA